MRDLARKVGISRLVRLPWLEETASLVLTGNDTKAIRDTLDRFLQDQISPGGKAHGNGRMKTIGVLIRTWQLVPTGLESLRDDGLRLLRDSPASHRIALHWCMLAAAYPFWGAVAAHAGRQLRLQNRVAAAVIQRRVREEFGDRPGVERATRYVLRSFVEWKVLTETKRAGIYAPAGARPMENPKLLAWMAEAILRSRELRAGAPKDVLSGPRMFPFRAVFSSAEAVATENARLDFLRHGLDDELFLLRDAPSAPSELQRLPLREYATQTDSRKK